MSATAEALTARDDTTAVALGSKFTRWGLGMFVLGFALGFVPILHYMHGAIAGDVGHAFMKNMTLWWGCPAVLMEYALKTGGLGMAVIGLCYLVLPRSGSAEAFSSSESMAPLLCISGLVGALIYAGVGYVVCNMIWPNFYFAHNETGKGCVARRAASWHSGLYFTGFTLHSGPSSETTSSAYLSAVK